MAQLNEKELQFAALLSEECATCQRQLKIHPLWQTNFHPPDHLFIIQMIIPFTLKHVQNLHRTIVCNELKNRGVEDVLIACRDNLSGFSTAIETVFPKTEWQLCVIHQIRNSNFQFCRWLSAIFLLAENDVFLLTVNNR
ncbi:MAG: Transposase, Mutator family [Pelotomaculum sp. PtaU1.Bin035]|nr:MAG: Transposase, Mutator family [Pelotomaculum sp. PtaU1.Bin035]